MSIKCPVCGKDMLHAGYDYKLELMKDTAFYREVKLTKYRCNRCNIVTHKSGKNEKHSCS
jgi:C4-type Zn-finger protein